MVQGKHCCIVGHWKGNSSGTGYLDFGCHFKFLVGSDEGRHMNGLCIMFEFPVFLLLEVNDGYHSGLKSFSRERSLFFQFTKYYVFCT